MRHHLPVVCLCCALLSVGGAFADLSAPPGREVAAGGENSQPLPPLLLTLVSGLPDWSHLADFYQARKGRPVWHQHERLNPWGLVLLEWIENASTEGLNPVEYHLSTLQQLGHRLDTSAILLRELVFTDAFLKLARDLNSGRFNAARLDPAWHHPAESFEPLDYLQQQLKAGQPEQLFSSLLPTTPGYLRLKQALDRYQGIEQQGGWPGLEGELLLHLGMRHPDVVLLRQRLRFEEPAAVEEADDPEYFDAPLLLAIKRFQQRHGLLDDGLVGPQTRAALNQPVAQRILQLRANLERWRWLPRQLDNPHLLVNTAGFELTLMVDGQPQLQSRSINGRLSRQTPSFQGRITQLIVNPAWTVPRRIAVEDLLPKQQQDADYLERRGFQVLQRVQGEWREVDPWLVEWQRFDKNNFPYVLRQFPGENNSLGRIKFQMPNPYAIYLHDTPAVGLFDKPRRAFSSGCVRVEKARQLAGLLLQNENAPQHNLLLDIESGETRIQPLSQPLTVYLTYFTSWVDEAGRVQFRPDIYARNGLLLRLLQHTDQIARDGRSTRQLAEAD